MAPRSRFVCPKNRRHPRRVNILVAGLLLGAGLSSGVGVVSSSPVSAIEIANGPGVGFINARTSNTTVSELDRVRLQMDWAVPAGTVAGDTIRQILPASLRELSIQSFPVFDDLGRKIADSTLELDAATGDAYVVFTFTALVEDGGDGATGDAEFTMAIDRSQLNFAGGTATIDVYGTIVTVTQAPTGIGTRKVGAWSPNRNTAMRLDADGRLVQADSHQLWTISFRTDTDGSATDDWTTASFTEGPSNGFAINCSRNTSPFVNGFRLQVFTAASNSFVAVPRPSPSGAEISSATCNADGSVSVSVVKLASDVDRQYRVQYYVDLDQVDGRPVHDDLNGVEVVGFPAFYRNDAVVTVGTTVRNLSESVVGQSGRAIGRLVNEPQIDIEKHCLAWSGVVFDGAGNPEVGPAPDFEPLNQPPCDADAAPGVELDSAADQPIIFTITNIGSERLVDVVVADQTDAGPAIAGIDCAFPDGSRGTVWPGPFDRAASFECSGTLPAMGGDAVYSGPAAVVAAGAITGIAVNDSDPWNAFTLEPNIDIENFSGTWEGVVFTNGVPTLDALGQPTPQPTGDFDSGKLTVDAGQDVPVRFIVTNTGTATLTNVVVTDVADMGPALAGVSCTFPDGSAGTTWAGPFEPEASFACTATLPGLDADVMHQNTAAVKGDQVLETRVVTVDDSDVWAAQAPPVTTTTTTTTTTTPVTPATEPTNPSTTTPSATTVPSSATTAPSSTTVPPVTPTSVAPSTPVTVPSGGLPTTGSSTTPLMLWAFGLIALGSATVFGARRRRPVSS